VTLRRRAAWLSLVAVLLGAGIVPALHRLVHEIEEHHEHEHENDQPQPHHHHHHGGEEHDDDERDPLEHGRGAPEHLDAALLASAPAILPPPPAPAVATPAPAPLTGIIARDSDGPTTIRGPPSLRST
jgi:hypothetical protein